MAARGKPCPTSLQESPQRKRLFANGDFILQFPKVREPFQHFFLLTGSEFKHRTLSGQNLGPPPTAQGVLPAPGVRVSAQ